MMGLQNKK